MHRLGGVQHQAAPFPEQQQAERVVEFSVGEQHGLQRDLTGAVRAAGGVQGGAGLELGTDVG